MEPWNSLNQPLPCSFQSPPRVKRSLPACGQGHNNTSLWWGQHGTPGAYRCHLVSGTESVASAKPGLLPPAPSGPIRDSKNPAPAQGHCQAPSQNRSWGCGRTSCGRSSATFYQGALCAAGAPPVRNRRLPPKVVHLTSREPLITRLFCGSTIHHLHAV